MRLNVFPAGIMSEDGKSAVLLCFPHMTVAAELWVMVSVADVES